MQVNSLRIENFRNIVEMEIEPDSGVNVIYGKNGQGKTNLLESIWLFTGCKSFRTSKDTELVKMGCENSSVSAEFTTSYRENKGLIFIDTRRRAALNGVELSSPRELIGKFYSVVFSPVHISLVKEGPLFRRRFIDTAISQIDSVYAKKLTYYNHLIRQKNALLKNAATDNSLLDTFDVWDEKIAEAGAEIISDRIDYLKLLKDRASRLYSEICENTEKMDIKYLSNVSYESEAKEDIKNCFYEKLLRNRSNDLYLKSTNEGPHRDDIEIFINGSSARKFGSQGQQRSASLSLKLGEAEIIRDLKQEEPIILLDDVLSELDSVRQGYILNKIGGKQVFITCCEPETVSRLSAGKVIKIENGKAVK